MQATEHCELFAIPGDEMYEMMRDFAEPRADIVGLAKRRLKELLAHDYAARCEHKVAIIALRFVSRLAKRPIPPSAAAFLGIRAEAEALLVVR